MSGEPSDQLSQSAERYASSAHAPDAFVFDDIVLAEMPVRIGGRSYRLREASAETARKWRNALLRGTKLGPDGKPVSLDGVADSETYLVSLCMVELSEPAVPGHEPAVEVPVPLSTVRGWPNRIIRPLHDWVKRVSQLEEKEPEASLKNGQAAGRGGSAPPSGSD